MSFTILRILIVVVVFLSVISDAAQARHRKGHMHGQMPSAPFVTPAPSPRLNTSVTNQPGVPNTSRPGTIGTGAVPSGLSGDSPTSPGFPGKVGRD